MSWAMRSTLISDAHLDALFDQGQADLVSFMREWETDEWVFVGDILDFGWSWKTTIYLAHAPFWAALVEARQRGQRVVWVRGNHDFGMEADGLQAIGVELCDVWTRPMGDGCIGAIHGDHNDQSFPDRVFRRLSRGRGAQAVAGVLGPERLWRVASWLSKASRERRSEERSRSVLERQSLLVERQLARGWDACCVGHTHAPGSIRLEGGLHVNLGDWLEHRTFAVIEQQVQIFRWHQGAAYPVEGPPRRRVEWGIQPC